MADKKEKKETGEFEKFINAWINRCCAEHDIPKDVFFMNFWNERSVSLRTVKK